MRTKAILLAGGLGTRLRPITETVPKCLVPVAGRPMLDYWLDALEAAGVREVIINTHHLRAQVQDFIVSANKVRTIQITESWEPELLGSAGTVHANRNWADDADDVIVIYADNLSDVRLMDLMDAHRVGEQPMTMMLFHTDYPEQCGIATLADNGQIVEFIEKPANPASNLANAGIYAVTADTWRAIADMDVFDFGFDVLGQYVGRMQGFIHKGYHRDIGNHDALEAANKEAPALFEGNA